MTEDNDYIEYNDYMPETLPLYMIILNICMFSGWLIGGIVGLGDMIGFWESNDIGRHIAIWPMILVAMITMNGTPTKKSPNKGA